LRLSAAHPAGEIANVPQTDVRETDDRTVEQAVLAGSAQQSLRILTELGIQMLPDAGRTGLFRLPAAIARRGPFPAHHLFADGLDLWRVEKLIIGKLLRDVEPLTFGIAQVIAIAHGDGTELMKSLLIGLTMDPGDGAESLVGVLSRV
jgi:hypothetical protein